MKSPRFDVRDQIRTAAGTGAGSGFVPPAREASPPPALGPGPRRCHEVTAQTVLPEKICFCFTNKSLLGTLPAGSQLSLGRPLPGGAFLLGTGHGVLPGTHGLQAGPGRPSTVPWPSLSQTCQECPASPASPASRPPSLPGFPGLPGLPAVCPTPLSPTLFPDFPHMLASVTSLCPLSCIGG